MTLNNTIYRSLILITLFLCFSCNSNNKGTVGSDEIVKVDKSYDIKGVELELCSLDGGTFTMWVTPDGRKINGAEEPVQVLLNGFAISKNPISQKLWKAVMGNNPSSVQNDALPVDRVTYADCIKFTKKISKLTGLPFTLPTEAQWEYANLSDSVVLVDNTKEWVNDWYLEKYDKYLITNPIGASDGSKGLIREPFTREAYGRKSKSSGLVFRVVVNTNQPIGDNVLAMINERLPKPSGISETKIYEVNGVKFKMIGVKGGSFMMGESKLTSMIEDDEKPFVSVNVGDFSIGETEVTCALWNAVTGRLPYGNSMKNPEKPVVSVSWFDCQEFLLKLNEITGMKFRLPYEDEWEYAAKGGNKSHSYQFSGSDIIDEVAVYAEKGYSKVADVKSKRPNELGIYDMSGNAWEWCQNPYYSYSDKTYNVEDSDYVTRGGSSAGKTESCRVVNRSKLVPTMVKSTVGFRIAL